MAHEERREERARDEQPDPEPPRDKRAPVERPPNPWDADRHRSGTFRIPRI